MIRMFGLCLLGARIGYWYDRSTDLFRMTDRSRHELAFGHYFDAHGVLRDKKTGDQFCFDDYNGNNEKNQRRYEELGESITDFVYEELEKAGLERIFVPNDATEDESRGFFFASPNACDIDTVLVVLIHGSGAVRAGQWARSLIINANLDVGSQLPYIRECLKRGYGVIVLNTNQNQVGTMMIRENGTPDAHGKYVWREYISRGKCQNIAIVAHSAGGCVALTLARAFEEDFVRRVKAVCFTDSVHASPIDDRTHSAWWKHLCKTGQNWVTSKRPVGAREKRRQHSVTCVSAGTAVHEETSAVALHSIFDFIRENVYGLTSNDNDLGDSGNDFVKVGEA